MVFSSLTGLITVSAGPGISSDSSALPVCCVFVSPGLALQFSLPHLCTSSFYLTPLVGKVPANAGFLGPFKTFKCTLLEQKILLITGFTHIRLETLGSVKFSAVNQQTPKEGEVCSEKFTGELIPNVPTVVAYHC